ncbi:unnamed protein product [Acanthosepion pharaonis]|uniref:G-protein coupled receptors family 1 profile domain-containing protein n=1 Tax=Acanthosepion pharaonis TaxID=158019 RepID=A0A812E686_ACAPH|nr:unnamed protein product [Sepia pharaonis]
MSVHFFSVLENIIRLVGFQLYVSVGGNVTLLPSLTVLTSQSFLSCKSYGYSNALILLLIILSRKHMSTSTNNYLIGLATADLIFLTIMSLRLWGIMVSEYHINTWLIFIAYSEIFLKMFNLTSVWITVVLAMERFIAICYPYRAMLMCTVRRARWIVLSIYVASFLCQLPQFLKYKIVSSTNEFNQISYNLHMTSVSNNKLYMIIYAWVLEGLLGVILPFLLILGLNTRLIYEIHKSTKYLQRQIGATCRASCAITSEQLKITTMLIGMCVVFLVCQAPYVVYNYLMSVKLTIEKFWITFKRIFCLRYCQSREPSQNYNNCTAKNTAQRSNSLLMSKETTI